jgi:hypothetical protein
MNRTGKALSNAETRRIYDAIGQVIGKGLVFTVIIPHSEGEGTTLIQGNLDRQELQRLVTFAALLIQTDPTEAVECPPFPE